MIKAWFNRMYNICVRNVSPATRAGIVFTILLVALCLMVYSMNGKAHDRNGKETRKSDLVKKPFIFSISLILFICGVVYAFI